MTIETMIDALIGREGAYSDHPSDTGGPTRWGVTEHVARAYGYAGDMKVLPRELAFVIFQMRYFKEVHFDEVAKIFPKLAEEMFDTGVNMGPAVAAQFLQRALNLLNQRASQWPDMKVDGIIGRMTIAGCVAFAQRRGAAAETVLLKVLDGFQVGRYADITEARPANEDFFFGWIANRIGSLA